MATQRPGDHLGSLDSEVDSSVSIAEIVDCGIPVSFARLLCESDWSSRRMRTDSPTDTSVVFRARRKPLLLIPITPAGAAPRLARRRAAINVFERADPDQ